MAGSLVALEEDLEERHMAAGSGIAAGWDLGTAGRRAAVGEELHREAAGSPEGEVRY